jgi:endonuclease YncB( thermonuclease family)
MGKYGGRVLGDVIIDGEPLSKKLIASGYAIPYDGGTKKSWCHN